MTVGRGEFPDSIKAIREGVLVDKSLDADPASPTVRFRIVSRRDDPVAVRLVDALPSGASSDAVSFAPPDAAAWTTAGPDRVALERRLPPDAEFHTHYTVAGAGDASPGGLLRTPTVELLDPADAGSDHPDGPDGSDGTTRPANDDASPADGDAGRTAGRLLASIKGALFGNDADGPASSTDSGAADVDRSPDPGEASLDSGAEPSSAGAVGPVAVTVDPVTVERRLDVRDGGVVVTHRLTSGAGAPAVARIVDPLPAAWWTVAIGFDPDRGPAAGTVDVNRVAFEATVRPDAATVVRYGLLPRDAASTADVERYQSVHPPRIETARPDSVDATVDDGPAIDGGPTPRAGWPTDPPAAPAALFSDGRDRDDVDPAASGDGNETPGGRADGGTAERVDEPATPPADGSAAPSPVEGPDDATAPDEGRSGRRGAVEDDLDAIRTRLDGVESMGERLATRLDRVHDDLADAHATNAAAIDAVEDDLAALRDDLDAVRAAVDRGRARWRAVLDALD